MRQNALRAAVGSEGSTCSTASRELLTKPAARRCPKTPRDEIFFGGEWGTERASAGAPLVDVDRVCRLLHSHQEATAQLLEAWMTRHEDMLLRLAAGACRAQPDSGKESEITGPISRTAETSVRKSRAQVEPQDSNRTSGPYALKPSGKSGKDTIAASEHSRMDTRTRPHQWVKNMVGSMSFLIDPTDTDDHGANGGYSSTWSPNRVSVATNEPVAGFNFSNAPKWEQLDHFLNDPDTSRAAQVYEQVMVLLITFSVLFGLAQAMSTAFAAEPAVYLVDVCLEVVFLVEIIAQYYANRSLTRSFLKLYNFVDLLSAIPLLLRPITGCTPWFSGDDEHCLSLIAAVPVVRLVKMVRRMTKLSLLVKAFGRVFDALPALVFFYLCIFLTFTGAIFILEPRTNIQSYSEASWLTVVSMTTLGYGDITPVSTFGRVAVGMLTFMSMLYTGIPIGIIGNAFTDVWNDRDRILLIQRTKLKLRERGYGPQDIPELFKEFDIDKDGGLNLSEFLLMLRSMKLGLKKQRVGQLFRTFDKKNKGLIDDKMFVRGIFPDSYDAIYRPKQIESPIGLSNSKSRLIHSLGARAFQLGPKASFFGGTAPAKW